MPDSGSRRWNKKGIPHAEWEPSEVIDLFEEALRAAGFSLEDKPDGFEYERATCEMCGQGGIRHLHFMRHQDYPDTLAVGSKCASKMTRRKTATKGAVARLDELNVDV